MTQDRDNQSMTPLTKTYSLLIYLPNSPHWRHKTPNFYGLFPSVQSFEKSDMNVIHNSRFPRKHLSARSSVLYPLSLIFGHPQQKSFSISYFSACMCLWPHKAGTVGCRRSESMMCV